MTTSLVIDLSTLPLYKVQRLALSGSSEQAVLELARRYGTSMHPYMGVKYRRSVETAYAAGWLNKPNPYPASQWSNFMRSLLCAWERGKRDYKDNSP